MANPLIATDLAVFQFKEKPLTSAKLNGLVNGIVSALGTVTNGKDLLALSFNRDITATNYVGGPGTILKGIGDAITVLGVPLSTALLPSINTDDTFRIISGKEKTTGFPTYLIHNPGFSSGTILAGGGNPNLQLIINSVSVTISANIVVAGLSLAPAATNTCLINDIFYTNQDFTAVEGEHGNTHIIIDTIGANITAVNGTIQPFLRGTEYFLARVDTTNNRLIAFQRGIAGSNRVTLADNDSITLLRANYIFLQDDGVTTYSTTLHPTYQSVDPLGPVAGQWYFDTTNRVWKRYNGAVFVQINAIWLGYVILDSTQAVAAVPKDFDLNWRNDLQHNLQFISVSIIRVTLSKISVGGRFFNTDGNFQDIDLSVAGDREAGVLETASTTYYIYVDRNLKSVYSNKVPRVKGLQQGFYHPQEYWRCIGAVRNDAGSNILEFTYFKDFTYYAAIQDTTASLGTTLTNFVFPSVPSITMSLSGYPAAAANGSNTDAGVVQRNRYSATTNVIFRNNAGNASGSAAPGSAPINMIINNQVLVIAKTAFPALGGTNMSIFGYYINY